MTKSTDTKPAVSAGAQPRMYPSNQLPQQVRDPRDGPSAFAVIRDTFFQPR